MSVRVAFTIVNLQSHLRSNSLDSWNVTAGLPFGVNLSQKREVWVRRLHYLKHRKQMRYIWGAHSGTAEDSRLLGCNAVLAVVQFPTFHPGLLSKRRGLYAKTKERHVTQYPDYSWVLRILQTLFSTLILRSKRQLISSALNPLNSAFSNCGSWQPAGG